MIYASLDTRIVDNDIARVWTMTVNEKLSESGRESVKTLWENRCKARQQRSLMIIGYNQAGEPTGSADSPSEWKHVVPDSIGSKVFQVACEGVSEGMMPVLDMPGTPVEVARELFADS